MAETQTRRGFLKKSAVLAAGLSLLPGSALAQIETSPIVKLSIVKPSDANIYEGETEKFQKAVADVRDWYLKNLGVTFEVKNGVSVIDLPSKTTAQVLSEGEESWRTGLAGVTGGLSTRKNTLDVILLIGGGDTARGGTWTPNKSSGYLVLGDLVRESINGKENSATITCTTSPHGPHWQCTPDQARGAIAHELGHAFSLPHPEESEGNLRGRIMAGDIGAFPDQAVFSDSEKDLLRSNPFLQKVS